MRITIVNFAEPIQREQGGSIRWWHKSGSRWPATIRDRGNEGQDYFPYPFLLCYLKPVLESRGHEVVFLDGCVSKWTAVEAVEAIRKSAPDFIIFETSEQTEERDKSFLEKLGGYVPVCLVGPNVEESRKDLLTWPGVDAGVPGEFILSVADFFDAPFSGMAPRREVLGVEGMDSLPFAYRDAQIFPRYNARFKTTPQGMQAQFVSMWGCQYRCKFCIWIHSFWPRSSQKQKHFSVPRLEAEIDHILTHFPQATSLYDDCDNHFLRDDDAYQYAEMMRSKRLPWALLTRADTFMKEGGINFDLWRHYRDCGCYAVKIGVEGAQEAMDASNKRLSEEVVREFVAFMKDLGISVYASFMVGVPGTGPETDNATVKFADELAADRSHLFEYFISSCNITKTSPFAADVTPNASLLDGQEEAERTIEERDLLSVTSTGITPLNMPVTKRP